MIAARPLTIAEIFDRSVAIVVQRRRIVLVLVAIDSTPNAAIIAFTRGRDTAGATIAVSFAAALLIGALTFSALVRLGGEADVPDDVAVVLRRALRDYRRSLSSFIVLYVALIVVAGIAALGIVAVIAGARFVFGVGLSVVGSIVVLLLLVAVIVPFFVIGGIAYANVFLERVGAWRGLGSAFVRCRRSGAGRTWLLGAAIAIVGLAPTLMLDALLRPLATATGMWWLLVPVPYVSMLTGGVLATVTSAVAAVDYRNRCEGADLHATLDAAAPAS